MVRSSLVPGLLASAIQRYSERIKEERMNHLLRVVGNAVATAVMLTSLTLLALLYSDNMVTVVEETYFYVLRQIRYFKNFLGLV